MGQSKEEQKQKALINREANNYLWQYLKDNLLLKDKLSRKMNVHKYYGSKIIGYQNGKSKQRALARYMINNNNKLPYSINDLKGLSSYKPKPTKIKTKLSKEIKTNFYKSKEWRSLRVKALTKLGRKCCLCGRSPKDGIILHVDHIKPRSKHPSLELELSNLQVLCEDCNLGKSNKYDEDWR